MAATRRYYSSVAQATTLAADATSGATTLAISAAVGLPATYPYTMLIDDGTVNEELVTVTNRSGTTLTVTRGVDGTTGVAHTTGASIKHAVSARDFDEANAVTSAATAKGQVLVSTAAGTWTALASGSDGNVLTADSSTSAGVKWGAGGTGGGAAGFEPFFTIGA